jgi:small subunit ribosomal protein S16
MATIIRLKRGGRTHAPYYRVVVADSRNATTGSIIEELGIYHPCSRPEPKLEIDADKALKWMAKGVTLSDTIHSLFSKKGLLAQHNASQKPAAKA